MLPLNTSPAGPDAIDALGNVLEHASQVVLGKRLTLRLALGCLLARGHLLIEDIPGVGKTTLAHTLAHLLGLDFRRVQFTSDLLPADILGASVLEPSSHSFRFHPGPVFTQLLLCDEINRATPKTQSALLEAMEERQVTHDGERFELPTPFFVVATRNPQRQIGTFALPESQLDRFLMRITVGYPDRDAERALLMGEDRRQVLATMRPVLTPQALLALQDAAERVHVSEPLVDYVQALLNATRTGTSFDAGLSPRAGLAVLAAARAWALLDARAHVLPEDVQAVLPAVAAHRLTRADGEPANDEHVHEMLRHVPIP